MGKSTTYWGYHRSLWKWQSFLPLVKTPFASLQSRLRQLTSSEVEDNFQVKLNETEESTESLVPWEPRFWYLVYKEKLSLSMDKETQVLTYKWFILILWFSEDLRAQSLISPPVGQPYVRLLCHKHHGDQAAFLSTILSLFLSNFTWVHM